MGLDQPQDVSSPAGNRLLVLHGPDSSYTRPVGEQEFLEGGGIVRIPFESGLELSILLAAHIPGVCPEPEIFPSPDLLLRELRVGSLTQRCRRRQLLPARGNDKDRDRASAGQ